MKTSTQRSAIRLSITPEVGMALVKAKKLYPTLSDPEILKLGLAKVVTEAVSLNKNQEIDDLHKLAAHSVGYDYLQDTEEDIYEDNVGERVSFK